ncbi:MAG TPA: anthranilate synthase component I, partial [Thermodesulfovibrionales bacterium]|nr:anthranilate synthase component I [Thermodesulfovibrionales bacterium]
MVYPDLSNFKRLSEKGNLIPVYREILADTETPVSAFLKLGGSPAFLLESVEGGEKWARYSFLGSRPSKVIRGWGKKVDIREEGRETLVFDSDDPIEVLKNEISKYQPVEVNGLPRFFGGLVGYIGYDMVRFFERVPDKHKKGLDFPDMFFMLTDTMLIFDSLKQKIKVVSNAHLDHKGAEVAYRDAERKIEEIIERLRRPLSRNFHSPAASREPYAATANSKSSPEEFTSSFGSKATFKNAVSKTKEFVMSG